ncbi:unnamed protein product [Parnassius mnemosyne]|uniref:Nose resistant-to-fluoxetine protein N-terminal domain-containing protein n=1 Tax=Parnassius mnemosyne TaxID=213953 RepID=A0AAV1M0R2_9NEOP
MAANVLIRYCEGTVFNVVNQNAANYPFNRTLYEDVLNPELCQKQLTYITMNSTLLLLKFYDAGIRIPRSILLGNIVDLGNYKQCININEALEGSDIQGKYCMIKVPTNQSLQISSFLLSKWHNTEVTTSHSHSDTLSRLSAYDKLENYVKTMFGLHEFKTRIGSQSPDLKLNVAVCIPASCTTREALSAFYFNITRFLQYEDDFCRLPGDKPWVPADYAAIILFSIIGLLVLFSTSYDLLHLLILKKDSKEIRTIYRSFSVYTNTRRLLTFKYGPDSLECIDGIRALAMAWVISGHTILLVFNSINLRDAIEWAQSIKAIWITAAPITVDTFFMLSGLLVVYTTAGKLSSMQLIQNLPLFYLHRLLRMFPILAAMILYEVSFQNRVFDGPLWNTQAMSIFACRQYWWSALLHIQNYYNPTDMCIASTWYLSVDVQLHLLSPIFLFWILSGRKNIAWIALATGLLTSLVTATIYNFIQNFQSGLFSQNPLQLRRYFVYYYINTLTRASPFFVGMAYGYILHLWKGKPLKISKFLTLAVWGCVLLILAGVMYCVRLNFDVNWDNQLADNILNSFMRPAWALGLGCLIFACVKGYGGPINWLLCLSLWKLPARLSYAMYIIHFPIIMTAYASSNIRTFFSVQNLILQIAAFLMITVMIAFMVTVTIDAPFATLIKLLLSKEKMSSKKTPVSEISKDTQQSDNKNQNEMDLRENEISKEI